MLDGFQLDPYTVLGLARGATPQQVRDAFRAKSKKHHPDVGGDDWAFRIVTRAYELLGAGREDAPASAASPNAQAAGGHHHRPEPGPSAHAGAPIHPHAPEETGQVRPGMVDRGLDPTRLVAVEIIWMRYEVEDVMELLNLGKDKRNLSGSVHLTWPDPSQAGLPDPIPGGAAILRHVASAFESLKSKTKPSGSQVTAEDGRFEAWLSYPSGSVAWEAFKTLHVSLKLRGLGVRQWTRDLSVPREAS